MMLQLIDDVNKALDAECYYSALTLALTFPDICGKAEYPKEKSTAKRYKDWYDDQIGRYEQSPCEQCRDMPMPYLSGAQNGENRDFDIIPKYRSGGSESSKEYYERVLEFLVGIFSFQSFLPVHVC